MNTLFSEKSLVAFFCLLFAASTLFLFWQNERELDPNYQKDWWVLSFAAPEDQESFAFTIENHSATTEFHYQIVADKKTLVEETFQVASGTTGTITPVFSRKESRTEIVVTSGSKTQKIYR